MAVKTKIPVVPAQQKGAESFTRSVIRCATTEVASIRFEMARVRLLNINKWKVIAGGGAAFQLTDQAGIEVNRKPVEGDYIRINIPGVPATRTGSGTEWVKIERIAEEKAAGSRSVSITVKPSDCPITHETATAHFFSRDASSTFRVEQAGKKVFAMVIGKNELPNTGTGRFLEKLRNLVVGLAAMAGLNKPQWKKLVTGILEQAG